MEIDIVIDSLTNCLVCNKTVKELFTAKTALVEHYVKSFGAKHITNRLLYIDTYNASKLINKYIKEVQK